MPGGRKDVSELTNKQLDNIIHWETPKSQKNVKKNSVKVIAGMALVPSTAGYLAGKFLKDPHATIKNAGKLGLVTGTLGAGIAAAGYHHQKKLVKAAKNERLKRKEFSVLKDLTL